MDLVQMQAEEEREDCVAQKLQTFEGFSFYSHRGVRERSPQQSAAAEAMTETPFDLLQPRIRPHVFPVAPQRHGLLPD
jgi:beta-glucosidase/6-phospho-beta-glucosidase/beta-galactosidase